MNFIQVAGHLGADVEERFTPSGQKVVVLRIASNSKQKGKEETIWWRVTFWGDRLDKVLPHLKKGKALMVVGELQKPEIYQDKTGNQQISLNINGEMLRFSPFGGRGGDEEGKSEGKGGFQERSFGGQGGSQGGRSQDMAMMAEDDEDKLPF